MVPPGSRQALTDHHPIPPSPPYGEGTLGEIADGDPVRLPDLATVFARRADRLQALAAGHELEGFLRLIAAVVAAQQTALSGLSPGTLPGAAQIKEARLAHRSPLDTATCPRDPSWQVALSRILDAVDKGVLPEPARAACDALRAASAHRREELADCFLGGAVAPRDAAATVFVAAALQVVWTRMAALLDKTDVISGEGDSGQCPACGSSPVAGLILPGGTRFGHRHLHCSLCATAWRYVRVRCVHCGGTDKISFRHFAGTEYLRAECCESCHGYSKVFYIEKVRPVEPFADDLASLGLDLMVGEEGFSRVANPFVLGT